MSIMPAMTRALWQRPHSREWANWMLHSGMSRSVESGAGGGAVLRGTANTDAVAAERGARARPLVQVVFESPRRRDAGFGVASQGSFRGQGTRGEA